MPAMSSEVAIGRRMNGVDMAMMYVPHIPPKALTAVAPA
jgi:hypothetical protein